MGSESRLDRTIGPFDRQDLSQEQGLLFVETVIGCVEALRKVRNVRGRPFRREGPAIHPSTE